MWSKSQTRASQIKQFEESEAGLVVHRWVITSQGAKRRSANALLQIGCLDFQKRSHLALLKRNSHVWTDWRLAPDLVHLSSLMLPSMTGRLAPLRKCLAPLMIRLARGRRGAKLPQDLQTSQGLKRDPGSQFPSRTLRNILAACKKYMVELWLGEKRRKCHFPLITFSFVFTVTVLRKMQEMAFGRNLKFKSFREEYAPDWPLFSFLFFSFRAYTLQISRFAPGSRIS